MSLKQQAALTAAAVLVALCLAGTASADDRDFLRERAAKPNLLFIVDSSGSMVGSPEAPGAIDSAIAPFGMVPGAGDDPYSRMGIAKRVLENFLTSVTNANYALASYAQAQPADGSNAIPTKHWVDEALGFWDKDLGAAGAYRADRFHMIEPKYAYRFGYGRTFSGILLDNPADILKKQLIGYNPYFDDALAIETRFGPVNAYDVDNTLPYDLMPVYFGKTQYVWSDNVTDVFIDAYNDLGYTKIKAENGHVSQDVTEMEHLFPTNSNESEGIAVLRALYTPLLQFDAETNEPFMAHATSITSDDGGQTWTVVLNPGWTFHDGSVITAADYVRTWSFGADGANGQQNNSFYSNIVGYDELNPE